MGECGGSITAIRALANRHSVLVAAPTGTGKTIIGQFGIFLTRKCNARAIYTTPIKGTAKGSLKVSLKWSSSQKVTASQPGNPALAPRAASSGDTD